MYFDKTKMDWNNLNHHFIVYQVIGSLYSDVMSAENIGGITVYTLLLFRKQYLWFLYLQACPWEWDSHGNPMGNVPWDGMGWDGTARIAFPTGPMGK